MDISVYFNDNVAVSSIDIHEADTEEIIQVLNEICNYDTIDARYGNENFKLYHTNREIMDECYEWKQKYENECKHNDVIKKSYDQLAKSFEELVKERDDAKYLYENTTKAYDELHIKLEETIRELNEYKEISSDRDDLKIENDNLKIETYNLNIENDRLQKRCATLDQDRFFWKNRWESEFEEGVRLKKELEKWQPKSES